MTSRLLASSSMVALAALLTACQTTSVVTTAPLETATGPAPEGRAYLTYPLATTLFTVAIKKGAPAAPAAEAKPTPTNTNTVTIENIIAPAGAPAKKEDAKPPAVDACIDIRAAYERQRQKKIDLILAYREQSAVRDERLAKLKTLVDGPDGSLNDPREQASARALVEASEKVIKEDEAIIAAAGTIASRYRVGECRTAITIEVTRQIVPDPQRVMALYVRDARLSADKVTVKLDANGFPLAVSSTADDKTGEVVVAAIKSLASVAGYASGGGGFQGMKAGPGAGDSWFRGFRPLSPGDAAAGGSKRGKAIPEEEFRAWLRAKVAKIEAWAPANLATLEPPLPEEPLRILISDLVGEGGKTGWIQVYGDYFLGVRCSPMPTVGGSPDVNGKPVPSPAAIGGLAASLQRSCEALVLRAPGGSFPADSEAMAAGPGGVDEPISEGVIDLEEDSGEIAVDPVAVAEAAASAGGPAVFLGRTFFLAADSRRSRAVPVTRSSLIARTDSYEFSDGRVTSMAYEKPSDALALASLPFNAIGGIVSGLSTALQGRQSMIKAEADLITAQASVIEARTGELKARTDYEAAQQARAVEGTDP